VSVLVVLVALPVVFRATKKIEIGPIDSEALKSFTSKRWMYRRATNRDTNRRIHILQCQTMHWEGEGNSGVEHNSALQPTGDNVV
jgi:hypothetical protein